MRAGGKNNNPFRIVIVWQILMTVIKTTVHNTCSYCRKIINEHKLGFFQ